MKDHEPTVRSRTVGAQLGIALVQARLSASDAARKLRWSPGKVSRMVSGKRGASVEDVAALLAVCGVTGIRRDMLLDLARDWSQLGWWEDHSGSHPAPLAPLEELERTAETITCYQPLMIPTLLQCGAYMRDFMESHPLIPNEQIDERAALIQKRQAIIERRNAPTVRFFIDQPVINGEEFGADLTLNLMRHMLHVGSRPNVEIRIVPQSAVARFGFAPPFSLYTFSKHRSVVYLEHLTSTEFLEHPDTLASYNLVVIELDRVARSEQDSRTWLANVAASC